MSDPFENWSYGDWANLKLFAPDAVTPYPDLNKQAPQRAVRKKKETVDRKKDDEEEKAP